MAKLERVVKGDFQVFLDTLQEVLEAYENVK